MTKELNPKDVELFLLDNLDFFESRESLVGEMKFKHSSSSASSILERQILKLREEHKNLINLLSSFVETANINEDLFNKSKSLTLKILESNSKQEIIKVVEDAFKKDFKVDKPILKFYKNEKIDELEKETDLSFHKGNRGPLSGRLALDDRRQFDGGGLRNEICCTSHQSRGRWLDSQCRVHGRYEWLPLRWCDRGVAV